MKKIIIPLIALLMAGCKADVVSLDSDEEFMDFGQYQSFCDSVYFFAPQRVETVDFNEEIPEMYLPDGGLSTDTAAGAQARKVTSVSANTYIKELLPNTYCSKIHQVSGTYWSIDQNGDTIQLSGKVIFPAKGKIRNIILVPHFTVTSDYEAPSRSFPFEGLLAADGYAMIFPDYIGYGVTRNRIHPYLALELTQRNCCDMLYAGMNYLKKIGKMPEDTAIYIVGYSQGGANAIACAWAIENYYTQMHTQIKRCFAGGGPYDLAATYDKWVDEQTVSYPVGVPLVLMGLNEGCKLGLNYDEFFTKDFQARIPELLYSKKYTTAEINQEIGTKKMDKIMTREAMDKRKDKTSVLYKAMMENSVAHACAYEIDCPIYMFHSIDDNVVPFVNAEIAQDEFKNFNIEYNFGHYGNHEKGFIQFLLTVKKMLK